MFNKIKEKTKKDFRESFHELPQEWRDKLEITNDIILIYKPESEGFTYDEYCTLSEGIFNKEIDRTDFSQTEIEEVYNKIEQIILIAALKKKCADCFDDESAQEVVSLFQCGF